jgi:hypothetical protein
MINEFQTRSWRRFIFFTLRLSLNLKERFNVSVLNVKLLVKLHTARQSVPLSKDCSFHPYFFCIQSCHINFLSENRFQFVIFWILEYTLIGIGSCFLPYRLWIRASWYNYESNQQDATIQVNLLFLVSSTCFGQCFRPSSGTLDCSYSIW